MYYALIVFSTLLFSLNFFANQGYQKLNGSSFHASLKYSLQTSAVSFCIMLILSKFQLAFSWFSFGVALLNAGVYMISSYCGIAALKTANLSVYSVFMMLGGMTLPSLYGIIFLNESITAGKIVCCVLIVIALLFTVERKTANKKAFIYYIGCFVLNGLVATVATMHQAGSEAVDGQSFLAMTNIFQMLFCLVVLAIKNRKMLKPRLKDLQFTAGGAASNGIANLLLLIALEHVDASVQYPLVTGGVVVFSALTTRITEKKITRNNIFAVIFAVLAAIFVIT